MHQRPMQVHTIVPRLLLMLRLHIVLCVLVCVSLSFPAHAEVAAAYTGEPRFRLVQQGAAVRATKATFTYSMEDLTVSYVLENTSAQPQAIQLEWNAPEWEWYWDTVYSDRTYADLRLKIDGAAVPLAVSRKAMFQGKEITSLLQQHGIALMDFAAVDHWTTDLTATTAKQIQPLQALGIFSEAGLPAWTLRTTYTYATTIPPGTHMTIGYAYALQKGEAALYPHDDWAQDIVAKLGTTIDGLRTLYGPPAEKADAFYLFWLDIPLWSEDWSNGVDTVTIKVNTASTEKNPYSIAVFMENTLWSAKESFTLKKHNVRESGQVPMIWFIPLEQPDTMRVPGPTQ